MSVANDNDLLMQMIDRSAARKSDAEAMTKAARLMRQAADILGGISVEQATTAAQRLVEACDALLDPKHDEPNNA